MFRPEDPITPRTHEPLFLLFSLPWKHLCVFTLLRNLRNRPAPWPWDPSWGRVSHGGGLLWLPGRLLVNAKQCWILLLPTLAPKCTVDIRFTPASVSDFYQQFPGCGICVAICMWLCRGMWADLQTFRLLAAFPHGRGSRTWDSLFCSHAIIFSSSFVNYLNCILNFLLSSLIWGLLGLEQQCPLTINWIVS